MERICQCWPGNRRQRLNKSHAATSSGLDGKISVHLEMWYREKWFLNNGSKLLEESIAICNGKCNRIRNFSVEELHKATNCLKTPCFVNHFDWYKGVLDDQPILVKMYKKNSYDFKNYMHPIVYEESYNIGAYRDIVISSIMSNHKNVLKLLGCCLELETPALVYENAENGILNAHGVMGSNYSSLSWKVRLRIAKDIANSLTYLHTSFSRPIVHANIVPENVFIDKDFVAKLSDFSCSVTIPEGEIVAKDERMTGFANAEDWIFAGNFEPAYLATSCAAVQSDVYSFGVFLLVLLTGRAASDPTHESIFCDYGFPDDRLLKMLNPAVNFEEPGQAIDFLKLTLRCIESKREDRPLMIDVAKELQRIERSILD